MMTTTPGAAVPGLRTNKRYITMHDSHGKSIYVAAPEQQFTLVPGFGGAAKSYAISALPADLGDEKDIDAYTAEDGPSSYRSRDIVSTNLGPNLMICDLVPGGKSYMHRTVSIDYAICVEGVLDHELDGGEVVRLYPGDHIVQRGTLHRWTNPSKTEPARFIAVTMPCKPIQVTGAGALKETYIPSDEWDRVSAKA